MPHFYAKTLEHISYPIKSGALEFVFEAVVCPIRLDSNQESNIDSCMAYKHTSAHSLILVRYNNEQFLLHKLNLGDRFLVKYNKHLKVSSIEMIKSALRAYAELCNANIIFSNLSTKKAPKKSQSAYLLTIQTIDRLFHIANNGFIIEIGFGSGRHILDLAQNNPNAIFLGIEIYRPAIEQVLRQIELLGLNNLFIINADCRILFDILPSHSLDCVYLHFPVPWEKNPIKRVFSTIFLDKCKRVLKCGAFLELRTDNKEYFDYAIDIANESDICIDTNGTQSTVISKYEARWLKQHKNIFNARFYIKENIQSQCESVECSTLQIQLKPINIHKILESCCLKFHKEEYFLHIKNIYQYESGFVLFILFGAYYAPNKVYLICYNDKVPNILGDIIPTSANVNAINLLMRLYGKDEY